MQILLDSGRWNEANKAPRILIYHPQTGLYRIASSWPYSALLQSETHVGARSRRRYHAAGFSQQSGNLNDSLVETT